MESWSSFGRLDAFVEGPRLLMRCECELSHKIYFAAIIPTLQLPNAGAILPCELRMLRCRLLSRHSLRNLLGERCALKDVESKSNNPTPKTGINFDSNPFQSLFKSLCTQSCSWRRSACSEFASSFGILCSHTFGQLRSADHSCI